MPTAFVCQAATPSNKSQRLFAAHTINLAVVSLPVRTHNHLGLTPRLNNARKGCMLNSATRRDAAAQTVILQQKLIVLQKLTVIVLQTENGFVIVTKRVLRL